MFYLCKAGKKLKGSLAMPGLYILFICRPSTSFSKKVGPDDADRMTNCESQLDGNKLTKPFTLNPGVPQIVTQRSLVTCLGPGANDSQ